MASSIQWTCVWVSSTSCWWTGKPGKLQSMGSQRIRHDWVNWNECVLSSPHYKQKNSVVCFNQEFLKIMYIRVSSSLYISSWEPYINHHWSELSSTPICTELKGLAGADESQTGIFLLGSWVIICSVSVCSSTVSLRFFFVFFFFFFNTWKELLNILDFSICTF